MRARASLPIQVRGANICEADLLLRTKTLNSSRAGIYFTDTLDRFHTGLHLRLIVPFHPDSNANDHEETGEVIRIDNLLSGASFGVAVKRAGLAETEGLSEIPPRGALAASRAERRYQERFPLVGSVEMMDAQTRTHLRARTSDLSLSGCYVDTLNPFPVGTILYLWIHRESDSFQARAMVRTQHLGSGMGLLFTDFLEDENSVLKSWLFAPNPHHGYFLSKKKLRTNT